jgi:hypothetical protein
LRLRADFYDPKDPGNVVASVRWTGSGVDVVAASDQLKEALGRIFRPTPVTVDDPSLRTFGTAGPVVLQPGSVRWFQTAARSRAPAEGLGVRFVVEEQVPVAWEPAGAYRTFTDVLERRLRPGSFQESSRA